MNPGTIEVHVSDLFFDPRLTGFLSVSELKHAVAVTAAKSVMAFRILAMAVNQIRLTTGTMSGNAGHEITSKAGIIHYIQPGGGITHPAGQDDILYIREAVILYSGDADVRIFCSPACFGGREQRV